MFGLMVRGTKASGSKVFNMVEAAKDGRMARNIKANIRQAPRAGPEPSGGLMAPDMRASSLPMRFMERVFICGQMAGVIRASGSTSTWREEADIAGPMAEFMLVNIEETRNMGKVGCHGRKVMITMDRG